MKLRALLAACVLLAGCQVGFEDKLKGGRPFPCDPAAGEDAADGGRRPDGGGRQCSVGWKCGLENVCHPRGDAGPFLCIDDSWCEGGWACRPDGVCAPFIADGLRRDGGEGAVTVQRVSPVLLDRLPELVAVANEDPSIAGFIGSGVGFTIGDDYTQLIRVRIGPADDPITGQYFNQLHRGKTPMRPRAIAASGAVADGAFVLTALSTGYMQMSMTSDVATYVDAWAGVVGDDIRIMEAPQPYALVYGDGGVTMLRFPQFGSWAAMPMDFASVPLGLPRLTFAPEPDGGSRSTLAATVADFADVRLGASRHVCVASMNEQLWFAEQLSGPDGGFLRGIIAAARYERSDSGVPEWYEAPLLPAGAAFGTTVPYDGGYLFGGTPFRAHRVHSRKTRVAVELEGPFGFEGLLLLQLALTTNPFVPGSAELPFALQLLGPCQACPLGSRLYDFYPSGEDEPRMEARCTYPDGGFASVVHFTTAGTFGCSTEVVTPYPGPAGDAFTAQTGASGHGGWVGAHGQLWLGENLSDARSMVLAVAPEAVVTAGPAFAAVQNRTLYFYNPDAGFLAEQGTPGDGFAPVASVTGNTDWIITQAGVVGRRGSGAFGNAGGATVANTGSSVDFAAMRPPYNAGVANGAGGRTLVLFSSNDAIFSADVSDIARDPDGGQPGTVEFRIVPVTRVPIRSLAVVDTVPLPDGGVPYARAWALAREEVIEVTALIEAQWRARPVPTPAGHITELWADGEFARIGFDDGRVVSLPAQKLLADALPEASRPVFDYVRFRGQVWAIARDGLWRLNAQPESAPVGPGQDARGTWVKGPDVAAPGFRDARLFEASGSLYLFTSVGWVYRLTPQ